MLCVNTNPEQLAALKKYCSLEALRTPFDYHFDIRSEIDLQNTEIPTMLLQPFVENAILHGLRPSSIPKDLQISMWPEGEDRIGISIVDNGIGIEESRDRQLANYKRSHQGISTTQKRIELLNIGKKQKIVLKITDRSQLKPNQTGTLVQLSIPV
jgi:sensor histidine kinase YesM